MNETNWKFYGAAKSEMYPMGNNKSREGIPLIQKGAFNLYTMIPCPVQNRYNRALKDFIETYNDTHETPIWSPTLAGLDHEEIDVLFDSITDPDDMPDGVIATGMHWFFGTKFRERFLNSGMYSPWVPEAVRQGTPEKWMELSQFLGTGILAAGGWTIIADSTHPERGKVPTSWFDLASPEYKGCISIHGCDGNPGCIPLLQLLQEKGGESLIEGFSKNVAHIKHFSQILKGLNSSSTENTFLNILPIAAASQIPSVKKVQWITPTEGNILAPMCILVKKTRLDMAKEALSFYSSQDFSKILSLGGFTLIHELSEDIQFAFPKWEQLNREDYNRIAANRLGVFNRVRNTTQPEHFSGCPL